MMKPSSATAPVSPRSSAPPGPCASRGSPGPVRRPIARRAAAALACLFALAGSPSMRADEAPARTDNPHGPLVDECSVCHGPDSWYPARIDRRFDHSRFRFPLEGAHAQAACRSCHLALEFAKTVKTCVGCHQDIHDGELGTDCARCHSARSFIDRARMTRAHQLTRFPLSGAHSATDCEDCHKPVAQGSHSYVNLPVECEACHAQDYLATTTPDHSANQFSRECMGCHNTASWNSARFPDHDTIFFPINSGVHRGKWHVCSDCHIDPHNQATFSCFVGCHAHADETRMATKHQGVGGYEYVPYACYGCHPQGRRS